MTELTLGPVLDLIERLQGALKRLRSGPGKMADADELYNVQAALRDYPLPELRALAEQHAAQLREIAWHDDVINVLGRRGELLEHAADFLCAPRREPEAE